MDAAPELGEDVRPFCLIADHLLSVGLSPPRILAQDLSAGLLLIEDLGDDLLARVIQSNKSQEIELYRAATDVLVTLHATPVPTGLETYSPDVMAERAGLAFTKYRAAATGEPAPQDFNRFLTLFEDILHRETRGRPVLILRDYHAENLLWLPDRPPPNNIGLLDFQDAMKGHPAYDLMSLLQDVRREVSPGVEAMMIDRYLTETGADPHLFRTAYAVLAAQRHLRVLGVFARLCTEYGKPHYLDLIPRVWNLLMGALEHPALAPVSEMIRQSLPKPDTEVLSNLRAQCPTP